MPFSFKQLSDKLSAEIISGPEQLQTAQFQGLTGLRGLAILCVIFSHALLGKGFENVCYGLGMIGVQTFFVISGFLITSLLLKEKITKGRVSLKKFYIRRFLRLAPVGYLFLAVAGILALVFKLDLSLNAFLLAVFYLKNMPFVHGHDRLVGHFWSLGIEEQFYLIFPVLMVYKPNKYLAVITLLMILIPVCCYLGFNNIGVFYTNALAHKSIYVIIVLFGNGTWAILAGSGLAFLIFKRIINIDKLANPYFLSILVFVAAALFRIKTIYNYKNVDFGMMVFSISVAYVILLNLKGDNLFSAILNHPWMVKMGVLSYSLYIWQALFTHYFIWTGWFTYATSLWLNLPVLFLVAYVSYHFYEKRFLEIKAKFH